MTVSQLARGMTNSGSKSCSNESSSSNHHHHHHHHLSHPQKPTTACRKRRHAAAAARDPTLVLTDLRWWWNTLRRHPRRWTIILVVGLICGKNVLQSTTTTTTTTWWFEDNNNGSNRTKGNHQQLNLPQPLKLLQKQQQQQQHLLQQQQQQQLLQRPPEPYHPYFITVAKNGTRQQHVTLPQTTNNNKIHNTNNVAIFYNIFVPDTPEEQANALRIVRIQLQQIKESYIYSVAVGEAAAAAAAAASSHARGRDKERMQNTSNGTNTNGKNDDGSGDSSRLTLFYVTLGQDGIVQPVMQELCDGENTRLQCYHIDHVSYGRETVTLSHLYDFCQTKAATSTTKKYSPVSSSKVIYLHNKGSLHSSDDNERWRNSLTEAALSEHCHDGPAVAAFRNTTVTTTTCNLCGLNFYAVWTSFVPGNMFAAQCDYVQKLIPPHHFQQRLKRVHEQVVLPLKRKQQILFDLIPDNRVHIYQGHFGLDRYSDEHWIGSHPHVRPCDVDPGGSVWNYQQRQKTIHDFQFSLAPRRTRGPPFRGFYLPTTIPRFVLKQVRLREYYYLAGNLLKWFALYNQAPLDDSWAWTWFPDGRFWKQAIEQHGSQAVRIVTQKAMRGEYIDDLSDIYNYSWDDQLNLAEEPNFAVPPNSTAAVFYDIFIPPQIRSINMYAIVGY